jgi:hypothetical protein
MTDKLAEEIYFDLCDRFIDTVSREQIVFMAMQTYHEAKLRESFERENQYVTDEDIQEYALQIKRKESLCTVNYYATGFIEGAKAMRDGEIKPVSRDNDC